MNALSNSHTNNTFQCTSDKSTLFCFLTYTFVAVMLLMLRNETGCFSCLSTNLWIFSATVCPFYCEESLL